VFVDLGDDRGDGRYYGGNGGDRAASVTMTGGGGDDNGLIQIDVDDGDGDEDEIDSLEKHGDEWNELLKELETMICGSENSDEGIVVVGSTGSSDRDVASICVAIDLTQRLSPPVRGDLNRDRTSATLFHTRVKNSADERMRIKQILNELKRINGEILGSQQRPRQHHLPSPLATGRQLERLKAKVLRLQSINADLNSQANSLQASNERLSLTLDDMKRTATDATVEAERAVMRYETLDKKYALMDESYRRHDERSTLDKNLLQNEIIKLQAKYARLSDRSDLHDMREMDEIRAKYRKMSQEVHDLKSKNVRLSEECERKEREWEVRYRKETERCEGLVRQVKRFSELIGSDIGKSSGGEGRAFSPEMRRAGEDAKITSVLRVGSKLDRVNNRKLAATSAAIRRDAKSQLGSRDSAKKSNKYGLTGGKSVATILQLNSSFAWDINCHTSRKSSTTSDYGSINVAVERANMTAASLSNGKANRGKRATEALDKATSRKNQIYLNGEHKLPSNLYSSQCRLSVPHNEESRRYDSDDNSKECCDDVMKALEARDKVKRPYDDIQLMMRTSFPHASKKRRHFKNLDSIDNLEDDDAEKSGRESDCRERSEPSIRPIRNDDLDLASAASSSSSRKTILASYSPRYKGNIASYFKPPLAERSYPAYKPHIFFGNDLSTSLS
jgi:hypothetical protein